jgi:Holliday junction DNA helicase RuvA
MIGKLRGVIDDLRPTEVVLDVNGVGYDCLIPLSTYERLIGQTEVVLYIYTYHREDQLKLFGFQTTVEKDLFTTLLGVSGIGPSMALSILSGISAGDLVDAVRSANPMLLTRIPGIGKAKAEKLIFELSRRLKKLEHMVAERTPASAIRREAIEALLSLGFDEGRSAKAVDEILGDEPQIALESLLKRALRLLSA